MEKNFLPQTLEFKTLVIENLANRMENVAKELKDKVFVAKEAANMYTNVFEKELDEKILVNLMTYEVSKILAEFSNRLENDMRMI